MTLHLQPPYLLFTRSFSSAMLTMFNFVYTGENFGDVIFTDSTSGLSTIVFVIVSFLGNLVVLSQLVGSFQNYYGVASEKAALAAEAKRRSKRRLGYLCVYAQLSVSVPAPVLWACCVCVLPHSFVLSPGRSQVVLTPPSVSCASLFFDQMLDKERKFQCATPQRYSVLEDDKDVFEVGQGHMLLRCYWQHTLDGR